VDSNKELQLQGQLHGNPEIILADEPTGALDSKTSAEVMDLLQKLNDEGQTIILITHDINVAKRAKRIVKIADGKLYEGEAGGLGGENN
jgi:putative ABC transport system ATP-binding protein